SERRGLPPVPPFNEVTWTRYSQGAGHITSGWLPSARSPEPFALEHRRGGDVGNGVVVIKAGVNRGPTDPYSRRPARDLRTGTPTPTAGSSPFSRSKDPRRFSSGTVTRRNRRPGRPRPATSYSSDRSD